MGAILACIGCYCCLLPLKPKFIELIALLANLVEECFLIWGLVDIPWDHISTGGKVCFYITCGLILFTFIFLIDLMILRCKKTINNKKNGMAKCLCITGCILDFLAFLMIIISEGIIIHKMNDLDDDRTYWSGKRSYHDGGYFTRREWTAAIFSTSVTEIGIVCHSYCLSFLLQLINLKTDLSYTEYKNKNSEQVEYNNNTDGKVTTINVFSYPPNNKVNNNNNLTFLGYAKDGRPIYAGNNQYRTINVPVETQQNINQNTSINNISDNTDGTENNN